MHVTPVYKKGEEYKPEKYHPISLTCVASKVMEHIVTSAIISHLKKNNILYPQQHGFRRGRLREAQLLGYTDETTVEKEQENLEDTIVLDFSKAF